MKACYVSDLHLEFGDTYPIIDNDADILILSGDVGNPYEDTYKNFIKSVSGDFNKIFLITGNHEYYGHNKSIRDTDEYIKQMLHQEKLENVIFLNNDYYDYGGYRFIGSTLWSKITNKKISSLTNDFRCIKDFKLKYSIDKAIKNYNNLYEINYDFIEKSINDSTLPIIVITHHLPSYQAVDKKYGIGGITQCFASSCDQLMNGDVKYWFYGHTHTANDSLIINNTKLLCNPLGYPGENENTNVNKIIELENFN